MKAIVRLFTLLAIGLVVGFAGTSAIWAQDDVTVHLMSGCDENGRCNPVGTAVYEGDTAGRYLIPGASTTFSGAPIDVRGSTRIVFQWTAGDISDTSAAGTWSQGSFTLFGSVVAAEAVYGASTENFDTDASRMQFWMGVDANGPKTSNLAQPIITSTTPGLQWADTQGVAWVYPYIASHTGGATCNLFYYVKR